MKLRLLLHEHRVGIVALIGVRTALHEAVARVQGTGRRGEPTGRDWRKPPHRRQPLRPGRRSACNTGRLRSSRALVADGSDDRPPTPSHRCPILALPWSVVPTPVHGASVIGRWREPRSAAKEPTTLPGGGAHEDPPGFFLGDCGEAAEGTRGVQGGSKASPQAPPDAGRERPLLRSGLALAGFNVRSQTRHGRLRARGGPGHAGEPACRQPVGVTLLLGRLHRLRRRALTTARPIPNLKEETRVLREQLDGRRPGQTHAQRRALLASPGNRCRVVGRCKSSAAPRSRALICSLKRVEGAPERPVHVFLGETVRDPVPA